MNIDGAKSLTDLRNIRNNLQMNLKSYDKGNISAYVDIAVKLRILFCDKFTDDKHPLLERLFPGLKLHFIRGGLPPNLRNDPSLVFYMPATTSFDGKGGSKMEKLFDEQNVPVMNIEDWLEQKILNNSITLKELIISVADKEGAHSDIAYNDTLNFGRQMLLPDKEIYKETIAAIGRYALRVLQSLHLPKN